MVASIAAARGALVTDAVQKAKGALAGACAKAVETLVGLLGDDTAPHAVRRQAACDVLRLAGVEDAAEQPSAADVGGAEGLTWHELEVACLAIADRARQRDFAARRALPSGAASGAGEGAGDEPAQPSSSSTLRRCRCGVWTPASAPCKACGGSPAPEAAEGGEGG